MSCVSERTIDDEDDPKDVRVEVAGRVLRCLRPRVPHVREPKRRDADQQHRNQENTDGPLLVCTQPTYHSAGQEWTQMHADANDAQNERLPRHSTCRIDLRLIAKSDRKSNII